MRVGGWQLRSFTDLTCTGRGGGGGFEERPVTFAKSGRALKAGMIPSNGPAGGRTSVVLHMLGEPRGTRVSGTQARPTAHNPAVPVLIPRHAQLEDKGRLNGEATAAPVYDCILLRGRVGSFCHPYAQERRPDSCRARSENLNVKICASGGQQLSRVQT